MAGTTTPSRRVMAWPVVAGFALAQAVVLFAGARLAPAAVAATGVSGLPGALWSTGLLALLTVALGAVGALLFRTRRLVVVWAGALLLFTLAEAVRTLYLTMTAADLSYQPRRELLARLAPAVLGASVVYLVVLAAAAAVGVAAGALLARTRRARG